MWGVCWHLLNETSINRLLASVIKSSYTSVPRYRHGTWCDFFYTLELCPTFSETVRDRLCVEETLQQCDPRGRVWISAAHCSPRAHHRSTLSPASWLLGYTCTCVCDTQDLLVRTIFSIRNLIGICISAWPPPSQAQSLYRNRILQTWFGSWLTI